MKQLPAKCQSLLTPATRCQDLCHLYPARPARGATGTLAHSA